MDKYLIRKARTQDSSLVQYIKLLLLSIYKIFFLLDCVIYACWGTPWKKFLESPLMTTIPMNIQIFTHPLPHLEFVKALHILLEHVTFEKEEDSFKLKTGVACSKQYVHGLHCVHIKSLPVSMITTKGTTGVLINKFMKNSPSPA